MSKEGLNPVLIKFRAVFVWVYCVIILFLTMIFYFLHLTKPGNYLNMVFFSIGIVAVIIVLMVLKKDKSAFIALILLSELAIFFQSYIQDSAMVFTVTGLFLILMSLVSDFKYITLNFLIISIVLTIYVAVGKFTLYQEIDLETGSPLATNIQIALPSIIVCYIFSYANTKILMKNLKKLQRQNIALSETQQMLISQARIESIQIVAGGIAHDFNNLLMGIMGNINLYKDSPEQIELLDDALKASEQAKQLVSQLLLFSKNKDARPHIEINLAKLIMNTVKFVQSGQKVVILFELDELDGVRGNPVQIGQVVQNLILNAIQSMPDGGVVVIKGANIVGSKVKITVSDEGVGIPEILSSHLFEPFYTTKESGNGLGLAICNKIIKSHHGTIGFESNAGKGSSFFFTLPSIKLNPKDIPLLADDIQFSGLSLLLDDNIRVLRVLDGMMRSIGFETIAISESTSFIARIKQLHADQIVPKLFIIDLTMPGDYGADIVSRIIRKYYPESIILVSSGYSYEDVVLAYGGLGFDGVLRKPFGKEELLKIINDLINI